VERRHNNRAYSSQEISLTANGVSLYFSLKNDPATKAIADDSEHQLLPKGLAKISPMAGLTLNAMLFKHSPIPTPQRHSCNSCWKRINTSVAQRQLGLLVPAARGLCRRRGLVRRSKGADLQEHQNSTITTATGPISTATGAVNADYVLGADVRAVPPAPLPPRPQPRKRNSAASGISGDRAGKNVIARSEATKQSILSLETWIGFRLR